MSVKNEAEFLAFIGGPYNQMPVTEVSGGGLTRAFEKHPDPIKNEMGATTGITEYEELTLKVPYDPDIHDKIIEQWPKWCGEPIDISVQPIKVCPEQKPDGKMRVYLNCKPAGIKPPDMKRGGNSTAYLELKFLPSGFKLS